MWRLRYEVDDFKKQVDDLYTEIRPLFEQLHAYAGRQLKKKYSKNLDKFPESGHIPSHIMGMLYIKSLSFTMLNNVKIKWPNALKIIDQIVMAYIVILII